MAQTPMAQTIPEGRLVWFTWDVSKEGYEWSEDILQLGYTLNEGSGERLPLLIRKGFLEDYQIEENGIIPLPREYPVIRYHPLHLFPGLYRDFAELSGEPEDILDFANNYGMLGIGRSPLLKEGKDFSPLPLETCESLLQWRAEIRRLRFLFSLWEHLRDRRYLKRHIFWTDHCVYFLDASDQYLEVRRKEKRGHLILDSVKSELNNELPDTYVIADSEIESPDSFKRWKRVGGGFYQEATRLLLARLLNKELECFKIRPALQLRKNTWGEWNQMKAYLMPETLLGAMYIEFYWEITGERILKRCGHCKKHFVLEKRRGPELKYCSEQCRKNAWYHNHKKGQKSQRAMLDQSQLGVRGDELG